MGFERDLVLRALRQARNREDVAVDLLLTDRVNSNADGGDDDDEEEEGSIEGGEENDDEDGEFGPTPSTWEGTHDAFCSAMEDSMDLYMQ
jgi:hypothetical protein